MNKPIIILYSYINYLPNISVAFQIIINKNLLFPYSSHITVYYKHTCCYVWCDEHWSYISSTRSTARIIWECGSRSWASFSVSGFTTAISRAIQIRFEALRLGSAYAHATRRCYEVIRWVVHSRENTKKYSRNSLLNHCVVRRGKKARFYTDISTTLIFN